MQEKHGDTGEIYSGLYGLYDGGLYDSDAAGPRNAKTAGHKVRPK
ncbi:hypothetical protein HMPREF1861_01738 [Corynebacterium kroppenstedtii]|nr:hypothetical protein HMPREF1861_01738 [Corynebacterium kroppenstedtii]